MPESILKSVDELKADRDAYRIRIHAMAREVLGKAYYDDRFIGLTGRPFTRREEREWADINRKFDELTAEIGRLEFANA